MSPPNPKRPPRSAPPSVAEGGETTAPADDVDLPFDDDEVAPLQADDPRPQRVPQFPVGPRRSRRHAAGASRQERDREFPTRFSSGEYEDPGHERACLYVERGPGTGQLVPIKQGVLTLGRASSSDLRLQHPSISRRHAQLTRLGDRLLLKDVGSQNGTYVNRVRLTGERELRSGDEIALGNALLRVRGPGPMPSRRGADGRRASPLRVGLSAQRLILLAAASSGLVAVFLTLSAVRLLRDEPPVEKSEAFRAREPDIEVEVTAEPPAPVPEATPPTASAQALAEEARPAAPTARPGRDTGRAVKEGSVKTAPKPPPPEPHAAPNPDAEAEVLAQYESGHVEAALSLARRERVENLALLLERFQQAWKAGQAALEARDAPAAVRHFTEAHALDRQIAQGWGAYAPRIRQALTQAQAQLKGP
ncbi:Pkn9 associate protein 1 [Cystobacter fuscus]|uniref:Pkn9 associate protein 1 n=1 Tax=Cystobacter fuscus TaxID=43 RepID=A0A250J0N5_9BACT|nr:FHA domain-containing protein [Cystobacter fuscus]ATB37535.1 Pkn9 associate protein 1 [Cystobacter fuscus]